MMRILQKELYQSGLGAAALEPLDVFGPFSCRGFFEGRLDL